MQSSYIPKYKELQHQNKNSQHSMRFVFIFHGLWALNTVFIFIYMGPLTIPPLANSRVSAQQSPGRRGRRSPSDSLPGGGGLQGYFKANCGTLR